MKRLVILLLLLLNAAPLWAASLSRLLGTEATWASGSSLASNSEVLSGAAISYANPGYPAAWCNFSITYTGTPVSGSAALVWFRVATDAVPTYPSIPTAEPPHMTFPFIAGASPQIVSFYVSNVPAGSTVKTYVRNDSTGVTFTTWSLKCKQETLQSN